MIKLGKYKHFKGMEVEVIGVAKHSETLDQLVIYRHGGELWARPVQMFEEQVEVDGKKLPRFTYLGN